MNALLYTNNEMEKQLNLLELHLKQVSYDPDFCLECIRKHILTIEGLAEEGVGFSKEPEKYAQIISLCKEIKTKDTGDALEMAKKVREMRKSLKSCSTCPDFKIENSAKSLNTPNPYFNYKLNLRKNKMVDYKELGIMNAGQFAAEGVRYLVETQKPEWDKYVTIGGGIALQALGALVPRLPDVVQKICLVTGSNLLAGGVIKWVRAGTPTVTTGAVRAVAASNSVGGYSGKSFTVTPSFGGPTFGGRITAENIPTRYTRAGILAGAQAFEAPEHADLIRVD